MKILLAAAILSCAAAASACSDLSGTYKMVWDEGMEMTDTLEQTGCETIRISSRWTMPDGAVVKAPALTMAMDGTRRLVMSSRTVPKIACPGECYASWIPHGDRHVVVWMMDPEKSFSYVSVGIGTRLSVPLSVPPPVPGPALRQLRGLGAALKR